MPVIVFKNGAEPKLQEFWDASYQRLHRDATTATDLGRGFVGMRLAQKKGLYIMDIEPAFPKVWILPLLFIVSMFLLNITHWLAYVAPGVIFLALYAFWTPYPYIAAFYLGFYKAYGGFPEIQRLSKTESFRRLVWAK